jgi:hypothetical protein
MKKFEYHIHEIEFKKDYPGLIQNYLDNLGQSSWELIMLQPLQTVDTTNLRMPGVPTIKISFLCVFKRQKNLMLWIRKILSRH